jgi:excisionase family DNA binding protein
LKGGENMTEYLTVQEIAKMLKVHEQTVFRWIREGKLESVKIGSNLRITREQLDEFITKK